MERYRKQVLFSGLREDGQRRLLASRALVCGCGALGTVVAETLVRAGVGFVRIVDRDFVELSNLQRQVLFDEHDVRSRLPKAVAAAEKLRRINSEIVIEPIVATVPVLTIAGPRPAPMVPSLRMSPMVPVLVSVPSVVPATTCSPVVPPAIVPALSTIPTDPAAT